MTCGPLTLLASLSEHRFLARCTCRTLHLVWDNATVRLDERDLGSAVRYLQGLFPGPGADVTLSAQKGEVQVWLLKAGFRLTPDEFRAFLGLLAQGLGRLGERPQTRLGHADASSQVCTLLN